jgi:hypothetical protein
VNTDESLLDTFPGRLFIADMLSVGGWGMPDDLIRAATRAVSSYLYSDRCLDASVGAWSAVSTAWLREPPGVEIRPAPVAG